MVSLPTMPFRVRTEWRLLSFGSMSRRPCGDFRRLTGGVKDGVDNSGVSKEKLRGCVQVLQELSTISEKSTIAAAFSDVHGVYKAGNVKLQPELKHAAGKVGRETPLPARTCGPKGVKAGETVDFLQWSQGVALNLVTDNGSLFRG